MVQSVTLVDESVKTNYELDSNLLLRLFKFLVSRDVVSAYNVLCRYRELENRPMEPEMYAKVCDDAVGHERAKCVSLHGFRKNSE